MSESILPQSRVCNTCKIAKPESDYYQRKNGSKYPYYHCKACGRKKSRDYVDNNAELVRSKQRIYCSLHREEEKIRAKNWAEKNPAKVRVTQKRLRQENPERYNEYCKKYRATEKAKQTSAIYKAAYPKEKRQETSRKYFQSNKEQFKTNVRNRRAKLRAAIGTHTLEDIRNIGELQRWKCAYCLCAIRKIYHGDHIIPLSKGGGNDKSNIQLLCPTCNLSKNAKMPHEFAQQKFGKLL